MDDISKDDYFLAEIKCAVKNFCSSYSQKCEECEHNGQAETKRIAAPPKPPRPFPNPFAFLHKQESVYKKELDWKDL